MSQNNGLVFRRAETADDFQKIFELQNQNIVAALSKNDLKNGFLSGSFTLEQLRAVNDNPDI